MDENGNGDYEKWNCTRADLTKTLSALAAIAERAFHENYNIFHHGIQHFEQCINPPNCKEFTLEQIEVDSLPTV